MSILSFIDRIWTTRGHIELDSKANPAETFSKLGPLLDETETDVSIEGNKLTYTKHNPAAQDQLATFSHGRFRVVAAPPKKMLTYTLVSPALRLVFLAPLFFLAIAQITSFVVEMERPTAEEKAQREKEQAEKEKEAEEPKPLNSIDQWLGAPKPETLEEKKQREMEEDKDEDAKHSPTPAYVLAAIFAALYIFGRWLEPYLLRRNLRRAIDGTHDVDRAAEGLNPGRSV